MSKVTVIIPVLNGMPYLPQALASLETQTFRDFEVILWDNGSNDGTVAEARTWIPSRLPGRVVEGDPLPLHVCLARMVNETASPFCARMDADDVCLPHRFEQQVRYLEENPQISLLGCQIDCIDPQGSPLPKEAWAEFPLEHQDIVTDLLFGCPFCHPAILFRTEAIRRAGNYAAPSPVEDLDLYLRLLPEAVAANLAQVGLYYRLHPKSICASARVENRHSALALETVAKSAPSLFGMKATTYLELRNKTHPLAVWPLLSSAAARAQGRLSSFLQIIRTPVFLYIARCLTARRDYLSKLVYRIIETFTAARSRFPLPQNNEGKAG